MGIGASLGNVSTYEGYTYRLAATTGQLAAATAGEIFQFRWAPPNGPTGVPTKKCRILQVGITAAAGTVFTPGTSAITMTVARAWSASGTGGTAVTPSANSNKMRTAQQPSQVADVRVAGTAALGAGTKTLDAQPVGLIVIADPGTVQQVLGETDIFFTGLGSYAPPLVLAPNEGFSIATTALPALGTLQVGIVVLWAEIDGGVNG